MSNVNGISIKVSEAGERMVQMVKDESVRMHILGNSSLIRGEALEHNDMINYTEFIKTKFCCELLELNGCTEI